MSSRSTTRPTGKAGLQPELRAEAARDVAVDVLHLVAHQHQDDDEDHGDQHQDQGVLDQGLPLVAGQGVAESLEDKEAHDGSTYKNAGWSRSLRLLHLLQACYFRLRRYPQEMAGRNTARINAAALAAVIAVVVVACSGPPPAASTPGGKATIGHPSPPPAAAQPTLVPLAIEAMRQRDYPGSDLASE